MDNPKIFLSYASGGESENIVNQLDNAFKEKNITLIRDRRDLKFKGLITEFMKQIGEGQAVVVVISDEYLKSPYCMYELLEIYRNLNFAERIFPIVLDDAKIYEPIPRLQYRKHWEDKRKELDTAIKEQGLDAITVIWEEFIIYKRIFDNLGEVVNILKNINTLTPEIHKSDNFEILIAAVKKAVITEPSRDTTPEPINWNFIVSTLKREECVLFLGPELFRKNGGLKSIQQSFNERLASENPDKIISYNHDGFFLFRNTEDRINVYRQIIDFYEKTPNEDIVRKLAQIPFHTIVSINPDIFLRKYFIENNYPHFFEYFDKGQKKEIPQKPTKGKPLLYNLFGSVIKLETLILTHGDLFEYFKAILGNNVLPQELRTSLETAKDYIFLGFQFDKWYVQLVLSLLKLHDEKYKFIRFALENTMLDDTRSLCINHFKIQFIHRDNNAFINSLYENCQKAGMLRDFSKPGDHKDDQLNEIQQRIDRENDLLSGYEKILLIEENPIKILEYETNIDDIKIRIASYEKELEAKQF